jgi:hypothetical protein
LPLVSTTTIRGNSLPPSVRQCGCSFVSLSPRRRIARKTRAPTAMFSSLKTVSSTVVVFFAAAGSSEET